MEWIPAENFPGADYGGTPNQNGGIEGYWAGGLCAKIGRGWFQASPDVYNVKTFTMPFAGNITLTGRAMREWYHSSYGSEVQVSVWKNDEILVPFYTLKNGDVTGVSYNESFDVKQGDILRFIVGKCDDQANDIIHYEKNANIIGWNTIITYNSLAGYTGEAFATRINCGGSDMVDESGNTWSKDAYYLNGTASFTNEIPEGRNAALYTTARVAPEGECIQYSIPVPNGVYAVRLCFAEMDFGGSCERFMKVVINGSVVDQELDIVHDVMGSHKVYTKVYNYIVPDENNKINLTISSGMGGSIIQGIEIVSENDNILHINCGGDDFVDWAGYVWIKDRFFDGGDMIREECPELRQASPTLYDKELYYSGRVGKDFSYRIPVKEGFYSVHMKFAELTLDTPGKRPIDIYINGYKVKESWDALEAAGEQPMSADLRFDDISSVNGYMNIRLVSCGDHPAILRAIEID